MMREFGSANRMSFWPAASSSDAMEAAWPTHRGETAWRVCVHPYLFLRIVCFQEQELGDHEGRHHILDRTGDEDDALLQQTREDVVGALAPVGLLDHHGDKGIHVDINGVAHGSTCLRPAAWDRRRESAVSLENRNAFGHALITDIAGNVGDKPVLSENSIRLGTRLTRAACDRRSGRRAGSARRCAAIGAYEPLMDRGRSPKRHK